MRWESVKPHLRGCNHCGGSASFVFRPMRNIIAVFVRCDECGIMTRPRIHRDDNYASAFKCAEEWNRRP